MCWKAVLGSHKPGLMELKFWVNASPIWKLIDKDWGWFDSYGETPHMHHQFLGIWQEIYDVKLSVDNSGKPVNGFGEPVNTADKDGVPVIAKVRGSFPLGSKGKDGKSTVILPDDFGWLAQQFAVDVFVITGPL